jgi:hypothetical protein
MKYFICASVKKSLILNMYVADKLQRNTLISVKNSPHNNAVQLFVPKGVSLNIMMASCWLLY